MVKAKFTDAIGEFVLKGGVWRISDSALCECLILVLFFCRHQFVENNLILKMGPVDKRKVSETPIPPACASARVSLLVLSEDHVFLSGSCCNLLHTAPFVLAPF